MSTHNKTTTALFSVKRDICPIRYFSSRVRGFSPDTKPNRDGWTSSGLCPGHPDRNPGNFRTNIRDGRCRCFACGFAARDIIAFEMKLFGLTFKEALLKLTEDFGRLG